MPTLQEKTHNIKWVQFHTEKENTNKKRTLIPDNIPDNRNPQYQMSTISHKKKIQIKKELWYLTKVVAAL